MTIFICEKYLDANSAQKELKTVKKLLKNLKEQIDEKTYLFGSKKVNSWQFERTD